MQAYRRKAQAFHPDRAGGNPRIEKIAKKRFEELNEAFEQLRRFRRIFGDLPPKNLEQQLRPKSASNEVEFTPPAPASTSTGLPVKWLISLGAAIIFAAIAVIGLTPG